MKNYKIAASVIGISAILTACASIEGTISPMGGNQYKSFVSAEKKPEALSIASSDAKLTCKEEGNGKYVVVSQEVIKQEPKGIETGNKWLDKAIVIGTVGYGPNKEIRFEVTTTFTCQ
ncbi:MAG: hypothetical protein JKX83_11425 [Pseudomonadales bacterium]|nr:hypothetical protein [Pseudomonadales bacterium]